jgi:hypothetical protein
MTVERKLYEQNRFDSDVTACYFEPQLVAGGAEPAGAWLGMANYDKAMFIIQGGNWTNIGDQLDAVVMQATDNAGAGSKVVGKAITTYTSLATNEDNIWFIHINVSELDVDNSFAFIQLVLTVSAGDSVYLSAVCQRQSRVFEPVPVTNVTEIVD